MKKMLTILVFISLIGFVGCATPVGYRFRMVKPIEDSRMMYSDEYINISFALSGRPAWIMGQYSISYDGISFVLTNKTNEVMTVDWNKISFKDYTGSSGNAVMHKGIKYIDCSSVKNPTTIPPKGKLSDIVTPCYGVKFESYGSYGSAWKVRMLPSPRRMPNIVFGIYMPIQIGDNVHNYEFEFRAKKESD